MKTLLRSLSLLLAALIFLASCGGPADPSVTDEPVIEVVDFASQLKLNMGTFTIKQEVTVKNFVDGDTVHFNVPTSVMPDGVLKGRFLAVNTPESTGKIEPYGKAASRFTKNALKDAVSIIIESDTATWNADSTGNRYLVWVWYKTADMEDYRNLNLEILQNGLAIASNSNNNIYGSICTSAIDQARRQKLNVYSGQKDPEFYDGAAVELTLRELRTNIESYKDILVAFNCIIAANASDTVYVEQYDEETDMYYGISVYYGNSGVGGDGLQILSVGNEVRIVGKVQYYETGETWQISGLKYRAMKPDDPENIKLISEGHSGAFRLTDAKTFAEGKVTVSVPDGEEEKNVTFGYAELAMSTSISMNGLTVKSVYTTKNEGSSSNGAMTLTCDCNGVQVFVRTAVLRDAAGKIVTEDAFLNKTVDVVGIVDYFDGAYQIKVFTLDNITVK
ncbi:MAG: thermonuclease family protein [Clostridia bacterium]|nr:thermonuclease family protein [Clostridia bacterium]MBQ7011911.1 thermonuclease family protein [Clostridia bacterium]